MTIAFHHGNRALCLHFSIRLKHPPFLDQIPSVIQRLHQVYPDQIVMIQMLMWIRMQVLLVGGWKRGLGRRRCRMCQLCLLNNLGEGFAVTLLWGRKFYRRYMPVGLDLFYKMVLVY